VVKYHTVLHGIFKRAMLDRVIADNPSAPCWPNAVSLKQYPGYSLAVVGAGALSSPRVQAFLAHKASSGKYRWSTKIRIC
jgi:hypothetical protein